MSLFFNPIATTIASIKLGYRRRNAIATVPYSKNLFNFLSTLARCGAIQGFQITTRNITRVKTKTQKYSNFTVRQLYYKSPAKINLLNCSVRSRLARCYTVENKHVKYYKYSIYLKYVNGDPAVTYIKNYWRPFKISIPYMCMGALSTKKMKSLTILYTDRGLLSAKECAALKIGGILVCKIFL